MPKSRNDVTRRAQAVVRADASSILGTGHVMRCLALAVELRSRGWDVVFSMANGPGDLREFVSAHFKVISPEDLETKSIGQPDWLIVDHYGIDARWLNDARTLVRRRLVVDDLGDRALEAEILLDPNLDASPSKYVGRFRRRPRMLLGPRYALLRPEFTEFRARVRPTDRTVSRVLVSMGGADPGDATRLAIAAVRRALPAAVVDVVIGPAYPHRRPEGNERTRIHVAPPGMAELIVAADLAVAAAGTSALERAALGLPSIVVCLAENQVAVAEHLARSGLAHNAGWARDLLPDTLAPLITRMAADSELRDRMRQTALEAVDGLGTRRVAAILDPVRLRPAAWEDRDLLLAWSNDPVARRNSLTPGSISLHEHGLWLRAKLNDPMCELLVGENGIGPIGQIRLQREGGVGEVSILVAPEARGGTGGQLLSAAISRWRRRYRGLAVRARIMEGNVPSLRLFQRTGFRVVGREGTVLKLEYTPSGRRGSMREP